MNAKGIFSIVLVLILAGAVWLLVSRNYKHGHPVEVAPQTGLLSKNVEIDVFLDGSGSMRHFLESESKVNSFREFLRNCEFALSSGASKSGWERRTIRFWKFGPHPPQRLNVGGQGGEGSLREMAENPRWFDAPDTPIGDAFLGEVPDETPGAGKLRIVITDLYQSDGKLEIPGTAIGKKYLSGEHGAVAVYGVRNVCKGGVDDLPGRPKEVLPDAATSMPFYVLIAGDNAADVRHAQWLLSAGEYGAPLRQAAADSRLFASYLSKDPGQYAEGGVVYDARVFTKDDSGLSFSGVPNPNPRHGEEGSALPVAGRRHNFSTKVRMFTPDRGAGIPEIAIGRRFGKSNLLGISWPELPLGEKDPILNTVDAAAIVPREWRVTPFYCHVNKPGATCEAPQVDEGAAKGVSFCNQRLGTGQSNTCTAEGNPSLAVVIDGSQFRTGREYLLEFDLLGDASTGNFDAGSTLMRKWSLGPDEVYDLLNRDRKFPTDHAVAPDDHPGKTPNLTQLMNALNGYVLSSNQESRGRGVRLKTYYLYLSAR